MLALIQTNNMVFLEGHLGGDAQFFKKADGTEGGNFAVGINNGKKKDGTELPPTFVNCTKFDVSGFESQNLKKGQLVRVYGRLDEDKYTNKDGVEVRSLRVIVAEVNFYNKNGSKSGSQTASASSAAPTPTPAATAPEFLPAEDNPWA